MNTVISRPQQGRVHLFNATFRFQTGSFFFFWCMCVENCAPVPLELWLKVAQTLLWETFCEMQLWNFHLIQISEKCVGSSAADVSITLSKWAFVHTDEHIVAWPVLATKTTRLSTSDAALEIWCMFALAYKHCFHLPEKCVRKKYISDCLYVDVHE